MVTFNKRTVKKVAVVATELQAKGFTNENQALIIQFEDGGLTPLVNGLATLQNLAKQNQVQLDELQARKDELIGLQAFIVEQLTPVPAEATPTA